LFVKGSFEGVEQLTGDVALEAASDLAVRPSLGSPSFEVGLRTRIVTLTLNRDDMQSRVQDRQLRFHGCIRSFTAGHCSDWVAVAVCLGDDRWSLGLQGRVSLGQDCPCLASPPEAHRRILKPEGFAVISEFL